jgi:hypothetical protein
MANIQIKRGSSLLLTLAFANEDESAFDLSGVAITATVRDPRNVLVAQLPVLSSGVPGMATISVPDTTAWPQGLLKADLLIAASASQAVTETFGITVLSSVTFSQPAPASFDPVTATGGAQGAGVAIAPDVGPGVQPALPYKITITQAGMSPLVVLADGSIQPPAVAEFFTNLVVGQFMLAATVSGGMAVAQATGGAIPADAGTLADAMAFIGVAQQGGNAGTSINVVSYGPASDSGWTWTPYQPVFLGGDGALTQTPPVTGISFIVGFALSTTEIFVRPLTFFQL